MSHAAVLLLSLLALSAASFAVERADAATRTARPADTVAPADPAHRYAERADVRAFVDELVEEQGFDKRTLTRAFAAARYQPRIVAAMDRPLVEPPKWYEYAPQFLTPERDRRRRRVLRAQRRGAGARRARIRRSRGRHRRDHRRRDVLRAQSGLVSRVRRAHHARVRLSAPRDLLSRRAQGIPAAHARAGAVAAGPEGVVRRRDGRAAVHARQLSPLCDRLRRRRTRRPVGQHGRRRSAASRTISPVTTGSPASPCCCPRRSTPTSATRCCANSTAASSERRTLAAWESDGVTADTLASQLPADTVGLLALEDPPADGAARATYWIACANFFVITRYNRSRLYASAVWSLSEAIRKARDASRTP